MFGFDSYFLADKDGLETVTGVVHEMSKVDLIDRFGSTILQRGRGYYREGRLKIEQEGPDQVTARALGTRTYKTQLFIEDDTLQGKCNCPYDGPCKHLAALLLTVKDIPIPSEEIAVISNNDVIFEKALVKKSKEELVDFLKKHATPEQKRLLQQRTPVLSEEQFYKLQSQIEQLLKSKKVEFSFLNLLLKRIQAYWTKFPFQVAQMLHTVLGLLHETLAQESQFSQNAITPYYQIGLDEYLMGFLLEISDQDLENVFPAFWLIAIDEEIEYNLLDSFPQALTEYWPKHRDLKVLKSIFLADDLLEDTPRVERMQIFALLRPLLNEQEVLTFLKRRMPGEPYYLKLYAQALIEYGHVSKAIQVLDQQIEQQKTVSLFKLQAEELYELRIELAKKYESTDLAQTWAKTYLQHIASESSLDFAIQAFPAYQAWFEKLMEERSPIVFLAYLENKGRIVEAAALFDKYDKEYVLQAQTNTFFARHKDQFPKKGLKALEVILKDHLNYTSENAYRATAQVLLDMQNIESVAAFQQRLDQLKNQFKRRRNLMKILQEVGL